MPLKSKKGKQSSSDKASSSPRPWPDLPKQLLTTIGKQSTLMENIRFGGVTKSWRVPQKNCKPTGKSPLPQLLENGDGDQYQSNSTCLDIFNISFHYGSFWWCGRVPPSQDPYLHFVAPIVGHSNGWVIVRSVDKPFKYYLQNPFSWCTSYLPDWDTNIPFKYATLSSNFEHRIYCVMLVLTGIHQPALAFCEFNGSKYEWSKQDCTIVDPYSSNKQFMQFTNAIGFKGKFYALSLQGTLAVVEVRDSQLRITGLGSSRAVPSVSSMHFTEYLIESEGEILLIFLISRKSINAVDDVEIYRLQFERLLWVKMTSLGDRTLFVGKRSCISIYASKLGCRRNCVYFTHQKNDGWWAYDMERNSISPGWESGNPTEKFPVWDEPITEEVIESAKD